MKCPKCQGTKKYNYGETWFNCHECDNFGQVDRFIVEYRKTLEEVERYLTNQEPHEGYHLVTLQKELEECEFKNEYCLIWERNT